MAYIGQAPANKPVSSSDLEDGLITNSKLAQDIISGETELATAPASTDEFLVSDAGTLKRIDFSLIGGSNTPSFFATNGSAQTIPNATLTKIEYPTEVFDTDSAYDNTNDKFVVPSGKDGKYFFHGAFKMGIDNDFNELRCVIYKNGSALYNTNTSHFHFESGMVTAVLDLSATDYVEIYGYQSKGTGENTIADSNSNYFMGFKLI
jgi:hypothetical protein